MKLDRFELGATTALAPTPVVLVSSRGVMETGEDLDNIATVAWAGIVCTSPPQVSISLRKSRLTHKFIRESGEFAINLVDQNLARDCDWCGVVSGRDKDKLKERSLKTFEVPGIEVKGLDKSPLVLACRVSKHLELGSHDLFIADVLNVYARLDLVDEKGGLHLEQAELVAYAHGAYYAVEDVLGFFGYSVAKPKVLERRMSALRSRQTVHRRSKRR